MYTKTESDVQEMIAEHIAFLKGKIDYWSKNKDIGEYAVGCSNAFYAALSNAERLFQDV